MTPFLKFAEECDEEDDEKCFKQGKHIFSNKDGKYGEGSDSFSFTVIFARYDNPTHTFMFTLPLDMWAFFEEHGIHPIRYAHDVLLRWACEIEGIHANEIMEIFGEISCMNGRYITWKQIKKADMDSADWWKKS